MNLFGYLFGYREYRIPEGAGTAFLNLCMREKLRYFSFRHEEETYCFCFASGEAKRFENLLREEKIQLLQVKKSGVPAWLFRHRERAGVLIGILFAFMFGVISSRFVWEVRIEGNETIPTGDVLAELKEVGIGVGTPLSRLNTDVAELELLLSSERYSWVSVNTRGTVLTIQVLEKEKKENHSVRKSPANIVAGTGGRILYMEILRGNAVVAAGDTVSPGDLLISGLYDSTAVGFRYTRAAGHVFAETTKEFCIEIPFACSARAPVKQLTREISFDFFGKTVKVYENTGNLPAGCDTIEIVKDYQLPGGAKLPFSVSIRKAVICSDHNIVRSPKEAEEVAYWRLDCALSDWLCGGDLLRKTISVTQTDSSVLLLCTATGVLDIARVSDLEIDFSESGTAE